MSAGPELYARIEPIAAGSLIGEAAMLIETTHSSTVVARGRSARLQVTRDELHAQMLEDPSIAEHFIHNICDAAACAWPRNCARSTRRWSARRLPCPARCRSLRPPAALFPAPVH